MDDLEHSRGLLLVVLHPGGHRRADRRQPLLERGQAVAGLDARNELFEHLPRIAHERDIRLVALVRVRGVDVDGDQPGRRRHPPVLRVGAVEVRAHRHDEVRLVPQRSHLRGVGGARGRARMFGAEQAPAHERGEHRGTELDRQLADQRARAGPQRSTARPDHRALRLRHQLARAVKLRLGRRRRRCGRWRGRE